MGRDSAFGQRLAELRAEHGLSLRALGELAHYSRGYLWDLESGNKWPSRDTAARLDESLSAGGDLAALAERRPRPNHTVFLDDLEEIERRRRRLTASNIDEAKLRDLEHSVLHLIAEYERRPPLVVAPQVRQLRRYVDETLAGRQHPPQRERLYGVAVHLC